MRRHGNLYPQICKFGNIVAAYHIARRGKRHMPAVAEFDRAAESNLRAIQNSLLEKTFRTSSYSTRTIYEPKERNIFILHFAPDRIVQHALMRVIAPIWEKLFIPDSYACIAGRGVHAGSRRTMEFVRRNAYCLKCDVRSFYMTVDHDILMNTVRRKIKCPDTLWLIEDIVRSFPGGKNVPIGNLTSQWFGNLYLNDLDRYVKDTLKIHDYLRYCDDFCLFHNDKAVLNEAARAVTEFCRDRLKLVLSKCDLFPVTRGVDFLGYRHFREYILLRKSTAKRVKRRLASLPGQLEGGFISPETFRAKVASAWGWMRWANTRNLALHTRIHDLMGIK
jgi:retron-type reverse transcriptase